MKKKFLLPAVLLLSALCQVAVFAADTWKQEGNDWFCYDKYGNKICGEWRNSGSTFYYLDPLTGAVVTDSLVEYEGRFYYCDETGSKASGWKKVAAADGTDGYEYMYFNPFSGAAQTGEARLRDEGGTGYQLYHFDDNGYMLYGLLTEDWQGTDYASDAAFYYGSRENGQAYTGWLRMEDGMDPAYPEGKGHWFYFFRGRKLSDVESKSINGSEYTFDATGALVTGWSVGTDSEAELTLETVKYYGNEDDGRKRKDEWFRAIPFDNKEEDEAWYYASDDERIYASGVQRISGKKYLFDERGKMVSGLVVTDTSDLLNREMTQLANQSIGEYLKIPCDLKIMYFPEKQKRSADPEAGEESYPEEGSEDVSSAQPSGCFKKTGNQTVMIDGEQYTVNFGKNGVAVNGLDHPLEPKKLYNNGILLTAGDEIVKPVRVNLANGDGIVKNRHYFVVNTGGAVMHGKVVKDADGIYWAVDGAYNIYCCGDGMYADRAAHSLMAVKDDQGLFTADGKRWICDWGRETAAYDADGELMYYKVTVRELPIDD